MKKILGLDLGTTSIGWALVNEAESSKEKSKIKKLGVRAIQYDSFNRVEKNGKVTESKSPKDDFISGKGLSSSANRTQKRAARRNLQRFKLRRKKLIEVLTDNHMISSKSLLAEAVKNSTHETLSLRSKAATEKISLEEFSRILLSINKKRGYKSNRKLKNKEDGVLIDGMTIAKELYDNNLTVGQYVFGLLNDRKKYIPDFYRSDLQREFDLIWDFQKQFYPTILDAALYHKLVRSSKKQTWLICEKHFTINGLKRDVKGHLLIKENYKFRVDGISKKLDLETVAVVFQEINNNLLNSSGYLGEIGDRSKELYFKNETVGENLYQQITNNKHCSLKNQVFYRQDHMDEFETIWETQAKFHPELTSKLKEEIRDIVIFYQRKLKSQKHLIAHCKFEKNHKVIPRKSPLFQEFKIWSVLNSLQFINKNTKEIRTSSLELKKELFHKLTIIEKLSEIEVLKFKGMNPAVWKTNFPEGVTGNSTNEKLFEVYKKIAENEGYGLDWKQKSPQEIYDELNAVFSSIGIAPEILEFDSNLEGNYFDKQKSYQLWHLLYSAQDDEKVSIDDKRVYGVVNVALKKKLHLKYGFKPSYADMMASISFQQGYGNLSAKAIKKIMLFLREGHDFNEACQLAKYKLPGSKSVKEQKNTILKDTLELLPKNSLQNPVVEKILNQMVNVVCQVIQEYGKPDEVRIKLGKELKKSAKERANTNEYIRKATLENEQIRKKLQTDFSIKNPTKNEVTRFKLYQELEHNGYKTFLTNKEIPKEKLFSKEIDIEHIIPKSKLFDDSFSNKTLAYRVVNLEKADTLAYDFVDNKRHLDLSNYKQRLEIAFDVNAISKGKYKKLMLSEIDLSEDLIERELRNNQYIAKKATQLLEEVFRKVTTTTERITEKLCGDWDLINVVKELNLPKYRAIGLTEFQERKEGDMIEKIPHWTKINDYRYRVLDALIIAFTSENHLLYLNNLNASRSERNSDRYAKNKKKEINLHDIRKKVTKNYDQKNGRRKRKFIPPTSTFRLDAKEHLAEVFVSFKAKNKLVTKSKNFIKVKGNYIEKTQLTPRGQLHKETVYGKRKGEIVQMEKINTKFDAFKINQVTKPADRAAILKRLTSFNGDPKKAFGGNNSIEKKPIYNAAGQLVPELIKTKIIIDTYTIRKKISADNFKDVKSIQKIIDVGVRRIVEKRLLDSNNNAKEAFSNLDKNPLWLNKEKGITIKKVLVRGIKNAKSLHVKKDHFGKEILDKYGKNVNVDFVSTGNNHHIAIYKDEAGELKDIAISFFEAINRVNNMLPIIDKELNKALGWEFLFTMKQNEMFVFPSDGFNPLTIDLTDESHQKQISDHLFRVQKISKVEYGISIVRDYVFRHHLETQIIDKKELKGTSFIVCKSLKLLDKIVKVRLNHIGKIVQVGES